MQSIVHLGLQRIISSGLLSSAKVARDKQCAELNQLVECLLVSSLGFLRESDDYRRLRQMN